MPVVTCFGGQEYDEMAPEEWINTETCDMVKGRGCSQNPCLLKKYVIKHAPQALQRLRMKLAAEERERQDFKKFWEEVRG